ncbi:uncharacterized protein TRUGW13939_10414 [Talaromyces rugulosus]|uniref:Uncharacterized protein n=1 Tax=Talaromyces rugulosus TaxID=121627 RepID=A0A7H8RCL1_TALRU|nr:uncharacterized protein TRUGW13939_10414 [Talaromyces rugulosus]QKX63245.1 hypothetical protein TRUGW13939_10414 [Talaromyces rugulosus]
MNRRSLQDIIVQYPIGTGLDGFRAKFKAQEDAYNDGDLTVQNSLNKNLIGTLLLNDTPSLLRSSSGRRNLDDDLHHLLGLILNSNYDISRVRGLINAVVNEKDDFEIWSAVCGFFEPRTPENQILSTDGTPNRSSHRGEVLTALYERWTTPYIGSSIHVLDNMLKNHDRTMQETNPEQYYGKSVVFVQSSGMGKSRLADKFGETNLMINFVLREPDTTGYPPADPEILQFMRSTMTVEDKNTINKSPTAKTLPREIEDMIWYHSLAFGLLQASFEKLQDWVMEQKEMTSEGLAAERHALMAPYPPDQGNGVWEKRRTDRVKFCGAVAKEAKVHASKLIQNQQWRRAFRDTQDSQVRRNLETETLVDALETAANNLTTALAKFKCKSNNPPLVVVFDEAGSLLKDPSNPSIVKPGLYHALNRVIGLLKRQHIWFFFLSTESHVRQLLPPDNENRTGSYVNDPSARLGYPPKLLSRFPPFLAFQLDIENENRMANGTMDEELKKSFSKFTEMEHMAMFGRPLWHGYKLSDVHDLAQTKLTGGQTCYSSKNAYHVFSVLSVRVSLDVCLQNPRGIELARVAVDSYMRVAINMNTESGIMYTDTPSEPVLANAAMSHLCQSSSSWSNSIDTLTSELLNEGLIEKGLKGELYARLMLILARDSIWVQVRSKVRLETIPQSFTVRQFLIALYAKEHHQMIKKWIPDALLTAKMNFNHFTVARGMIEREHDLPKIWHELLRRNAGMQFAYNQPTYDIMIPVYFGIETDDFKDSDCGAILIQVKNKNTATTPKKVFGESFQESTDTAHKAKPNDKGGDKSQRGPYFIFNETKHPILALIFDLGVEKAPWNRLVRLHRSEINHPPVWVIHSFGHSEQVFGCLKNMNCDDIATHGFFDALSPSKNDHDKLCERNILFSEAKLTDTFLNKEKSEEENVEDGDTEMGDA